MAIIEINWRPGSRDLRIFAIAQLFASALGAWMMYSRLGWNTAAMTLMGVAVVAFVVGLWSPQWIRPVYLAWILIGLPLGWINAHVALAVIYYLVITPTGFLLRITGRDPLKLKHDPDATTYWSVRPAPAESSRYFRQF